MSKPLLRNITGGSALKARSTKEPHLRFSFLLQNDYLSYKITRSMERNQARILLAEDDRNLGNILKNFLDAKGYLTTLCINGQEAIDAFQKKEFDFCILDIMMPVRDGFSVAKEVRSSNPKI